MTRAAFLFAVCVAAASASAAAATSVVTAGAWRPVSAAGVDVSLSPFEESSLRIAYDFHGSSGWAGARREVAFDFPGDWTLSFRVRGEGTPNTLEIKFLDATGENVWWARREAFAPPAEWQEIRVRKRQVSFAWGPAGGGELRHAAAMEIVLSAGTGGRGFLEVEEPKLAGRAKLAALPEPIVTQTFSEILIDFGGMREFSALVVDWNAAVVPSHFIVEISSDGRSFTAVRRVEHGGARRAWLHLPDSEARLVRLVLPPGDFGLPRVDVKPIDWAPTPTDLVSRIAAEAPRGLYPRAFRGEQTYWTVAGVDADTEEVLVGEDGALEPGKGTFSLEPFLFADGRLVTWADAGISQSLERGDLPIPTVSWKAGGLSLDVTALVDGSAGASVLRARYRVRNERERPSKTRLFVTLRPFLVNPPAQFLNAPHGVSRIAALSLRDGTATVNGTREIRTVPAPSAFGASAFDAGAISDFLLKGGVPAAREIRDETGLASGVLAWDFEIPARGASDVVVEVPLHAGASPPPTLSRKEFDDRLTRASAGWGRAVDRVIFRVPSSSSAESLVKTLKSNVAFVLVNRDGPWIQPGSRAYERSWIRDGALTSSALLRLGHAAEVRDFLLAFAEKQFPDGKIPCCVDARGADPVPENDSHGEFLFLAAEYFRFTRDAATLSSLWPRIKKTVGAIDALRRSRLTSEYEVGEKRAFRGLLPESISHEGYSDKPVHSYWDDAFARKGLADAAFLAAALSHPEEERRFGESAAAFEADLLASISRTIEAHHLDTIPASVEKHDFDPTSTTVSLEPCGLTEKLPQAELARTFERYVNEARERRDGTRAWDAYTPYELRTVGALVRLGRREEAHELLAFFLKDRRPAAWNTWAEVVGRDPRAPRFVGDMPHTWVGTDFIRSFLDFFALERGDAGRESLLLGAGLPEEWLRAPGGVAVEGLLTPWGPLHFSASASERGLTARVVLERLPPGGLFLAWPLGGLPREAMVNGKQARVRGREILVSEIPAEVVARP